MTELKTFNENIETHSNMEHSWPHIPQLQWQKLDWAINTTVITSLVFLVIISIISIIANRALKKWWKLKIFFLSTISFFYDYLKDSFWNKKDAKKYFWLVVWVFLIVFLGNIFGLVIDFLGSLTTIWVSSIVLEYLRPINSDLNTTLVLWVWAILYSIFISFKYNWVWNTLKWYLFNFTWKTISEKIVNVFVWWLHLIWLPASATSLSLRLFGNIFAWMVLISVIWYLGYLMSENFMEVWRLLTIPFWFFELFVAFVQAAVFAWLMIAYFKQSMEEHH